jgi:predicted RNA-binding Zn-ribbon protein involved in translation (DUF1610 family)
MSIPIRIRECRSCGAELEPGTRFCAACGARVVARSEVSWDVAERRYFGVLPGRRFYRTARIRLARLWAVVVARLRLAYEALAAGFQERFETLKLRREAIAESRRLEQAFRDLGEVVYRGERDGVERARARVTEADARLAQLNERISRLQAEVRRRIEQAWDEDGPTRVEQPAEPEPPLVPEPEPVPHVPPGPVIVPEPEPVPHDPPGPVIVPEPQPPRADW